MGRGKLVKRGRGSPYPVSYPCPRFRLPSTLGQQFCLPATQGGSAPQWRQRGLHEADGRYHRRVFDRLAEGDTQVA